MSVIALGSFRGAPGVTTTTVAFADVWPTARRVLVVEADPAGGVLGVRLGRDANRSTLTLAAASRLGLASEDVWEHSAKAGFDVVLAPAHPGAAGSALRVLGDALAPILRSMDADILIDCGRLYKGSPALPFVEIADLLVVVARPTPDELPAIPHAVAEIVPTTPVAMLLIGEPKRGRYLYSAAEVQAELGIDVIATLAEDGSAAAALRGERSDRWLSKTSLIRGARSAVEAVLDRMERASDLAARLEGSEVGEIGEGVA